ncbi:hypothetical protein OS493_015571 [Desmophyllum pertusum]|uniref:Coiled-coil domain-containing protein 102A n=1 Tax=Desmophyllum pertusum TaxID=174260 RepID=A0A9W9YS53_9CNID|nr:hypothetical protein OS493_015571 [Desmophyllum pertusum]
MNVNSNVQVQAVNPTRHESLQNEFYEEQGEDANGFERSHSVPADERKKSRPSSRKQKSQGEKHVDVESSQQFALMRMKLEQTEKLLCEERSTKQNLLEEIDGLQSDYTSLKLKNEELKVSHQDYSQEIERLQAENTQEWSKREKLESDKLVLERENKKLRLQIEDLSSELSDSSKSSKGLLSADVKQLQTQLDEKNREQQELKYAYNKVRKQLQEKAEELSHSRKRVEQHENEVRKLRTRVEELKVDLSKAEDELDSQTSSLRKLQRNLDEQTERADSYKVQMEHLNSRLRVGGGAAGPALNPRYKPGRKSSMQLSSDESEEEPSFE